MSSTGSLDSPQLKLILEWGKGFKSNDPDLIAKTLHKDFRHVTYPRSLNRPEETKEEWLGRLAGIIGLWTHTEVTTHSTIDTPGKVVIHFTNKSKTSIGVDMIHEAITIAHIGTDEDGSLKIKKIEDFIDSKAYLDDMQAFAAAKAK